MAAPNDQTVDPGAANELLASLRGKDALQSARQFTRLAETSPQDLQGLGAKLLREAIQTENLRVRWYLVVAVGLVELRGRTRLAAIDWLFERLADQSPFTRTFALQSLWNLSAADHALRARVQVFAERFVETGTATMRARARKLLGDARKKAEIPRT